MEKPKYKNKLGYVYLPILLLLYIVADLVLKDMGVDICPTNGCKIASATLNFDSFYLNLVGVGFALSLLIFSPLRQISNFILFAGILFESLMIGYQVFVSGVLCYYCLGIYAIVWLMAIFRFRLIVPIASLVVVAVFYSMLKFVVLSHDISTGSVDTNATTYLFGSTTCPHCIEMKKYLNEHKIQYEFKDVNNINNQYILKFFRLSSIPVLVVQNEDNIKLLTTKQSIKGYFAFEDSALPTKPVFNLNSMIQQSQISTEDNSSIHAGGCKIDIPCID